MGRKIQPHMCIKSGLSCVLPGFSLKHFVSFWLHSKLMLHQQFVILMARVVPVEEEVVVEEAAL